MRISSTALRYVSAVWIVYVFLLFNAVFGYSCLAQAPVFQHLDVRDGLAQNTVLSITQDARGFMWFCTPEGLNRYDSRAFRTYRHDPTNPRSISTDWTTCSLYDSHQTLWIGAYKGLNKYDPETDSFQRFFHDPARKNSLSHNRIVCLYEDSKGRVWIGTANGLNRLIDPATNRFEQYSLPNATNSTANRINSICEDQAGNLWVGTNDGLVRMTIGKGNIRYKTFRHQTNDPNSLSDNTIKAIIRDRRNNLWIGIKSGELERYVPSSESFIHCLKRNAGGSIHSEISCIQTDKVGNVWIGTVEGVLHLDPSSMTFTHYKNDPDNPQSLGDNSVFSIFQDRQGSFWIGTYYSGLNIIHPNNTPFKALKANKSAKGLSYKTVNYIAEDQRHNLWIGADDGGLDYISPQTGLLAHYQAGPDPQKNLPSNQIKAVFVDKAGYTWVGMRGGGISRLDPAHQQWTSYRHNPDVASSINSDDIYSLLEDSQRRFWVLTVDGIDLFNKQQGTFLRYSRRQLQPDSLAFPSYALVEDRQKNIWIGKYRGVALLRNRHTQFEWLPFTQSARNSNLLSHGQVYCIHEDRLGRLWVGTRFDGLKRYDATHNTFIDYTEADGLAENTIRSIQSDAKGILWLGTSHGLIRFDPETKRSQQYTSPDGIPGSEFEYNASCRATDGKLYFGTNDGIVYFDPATIQINQHTPTVAFTALEVGNKTVNIGDESNLLVKDIGQTDRLTFNYRQNFFTINFAVLNYIKSEKNQYAYKLDGLDQEWHTIKTPSVTYNNLPAGEYTLWVKGANNDGVWSTNPTKLQLVILPPWWRSWWAYGLYTLAFAVVLYLILRYFWLQDSFKRERELNQAKLDFFTNISHEIRTHLTLIIGPIDLLLSMKKEDKVVQKQLAYAKNSSDSLLNLVSELITFRKAESSQLELHIAQNDIVPFLKKITASFLHHSEQRNIKLSFSSNREAIQLGFDPGQIEKIIYNLLSNAFKFMSDGGAIHIDVDDKEDRVAIAISDTGRGISPENVKKLFTNYFQVHDYGSQNTGYGIGLALSRRIAELHGGTLTVESKEARNGENGFTCFTLMLRKEHSKVLN